MFARPALRAAARGSLALLLAVGSLACGETPGEGAPIEQRPPPEPPPAPEPTPPPPPPGPEADVGPIAIDASLTPDPRILRGTAGGDAHASAHHEDCTGWIAAAPDHLLDLGPGLPRLRLAAFGLVRDADLTLVVHAPDGSWLCNDDFDHLDPMLDLEAPAAGRYEIYVGAYEEGLTQDYRLGVSLADELVPSALVSAE